MDNTTAAAAATAKWDSSIDRFCFSLSLSLSLYFSFFLFLFLSFSLFLLLLWPLQLSGRENIETTVKQQRCCHGMKEISTGKKSSQLIFVVVVVAVVDVVVAAVVAGVVSFSPPFKHCFNKDPEQNFNEKLLKYHRRRINYSTEQHQSIGSNFLKKISVG